jgi:endonuclease/exonuclease/phosphatase family metal-dependent hydrolase
VERRRSNLATRRCTALTVRMRSAHARRVPWLLGKGRLVAVAASTAVIAALMTVTSSPATANANLQALRVGSYNIRAGVSTDTFRSAVATLATRVDVAGLQEVNSHDKEAVLASMRSSGWAYYRNKPGEQSPVIWRQSRFDFLSGRTTRIAGAYYIGNEMPGRAAYSPTIYATVVHLRDIQTSGKVSIINVHLLPGAVINGAPTPGRPRSFAAFRASVMGLEALSSRELDYGKIFVVGDFNVGFAADKRTDRAHLPYASFRRLGMRSLWATERPSGRGSHRGSPSLIDQVYSAAKATSASVKYGFRYSDHFPVVGTYPASSTTP